MISYYYSYDHDSGSRHYPTDPTRSVTSSDPSLEPVTLDEAKKHLEIATADSIHDNHVSGLISAARQIWELDTQLLTTQRTVTEKLDRWPDETWRLFYRPVASITSITYYDTDNASQTLASDQYLFDPDHRRITPAPDANPWPSVENRWDAITITYTAGVVKVPEIVKHAIKLQLDVMFELRGMTKEKDAVLRAYESLVARYIRGSYP